MVSSSRLVLSQGPQPGQTFMLEQDLLTLGRDPHNDIMISDPQISRQHARIMRQGDLMVIEDAGSTNGTFVNGMRLTGPHALANEDVVGLGDVVTLTYYGEGPAATEVLAGHPTDLMGQLSYEPPPPPAYTPPPAYAPPPATSCATSRSKEAQDWAMDWVWVPGANPGLRCAGNIRLVRTSVILADTD